MIVENIVLDKGNIKVHSKNICLVDGYNVIYKMPELKMKINVSLEKARLALGKYIYDCANKQFSSIWVIFDGKREMYADIDMDYKGIKFIYSYSTEKADNRIIKILRESKKKVNYTVITDDNYIRNHCRVYGASCKTVKDFQKLFNKQMRINDNGKIYNNEKKISINAQLKINEFLRKEWNIK